jgi:hypothetical protein
MPFFISNRHPFNLISAEKAGKLESQEAGKLEGLKAEASQPPGILAS